MCVSFELKKKPHPPADINSLSPRVPSVTCTESSLNKKNLKNCANISNSYATFGSTKVALGCSVEGPGMSFTPLHIFLNHQILSHFFVEEEGNVLLSNRNARAVDIYL